MAKEVLCPICGATYNLADEQLGRKVRCKKCEHPFTAGGEPRRRRDEDDEDDEDEGIQSEPRGRSRAKARRDRDRDGEDEDRPRKRRSLKEQARPRSQEGPRTPVTSIVVTCVAVGVLVLCCGGGAGIYWLWPASRRPQPNLPANQQPPPFAGANQPMQPVPPPVFRPGRFPGGGAAPAVANMKEALAALKDADVNRQQAAAEWLGSAPRDEAKAAEVARALDPLIRNAPEDVFGHDSARGTAIHALKVWGTKESVPTLVDFLKAQMARDPHWIHIRGEITDAMDALVMIGDDRAVDGIIPFAGTIHGVHLGGAPEAALRRMGPKAKPGLLRYANDPNPRIRDLAQRLLSELGNR